MRQIHVNQIEEEIIRHLAEHPLTRDELLSMTTLLERIGSIDFSFINLPGIDLSKKFFMNTIINGLIGKQLVIEEEGVLKPAFYALQYLTGTERNPENLYSARIREEDGVVLLKPVLGAVYKLVCRTDVEDGIYYTEPLRYIGVHTNPVKIESGRFTTYIIFLPTTVKITKKNPLFSVERIR